ncbi:MAG: hypothetical protein HYY30_03970 [Chloroflexi bacterium]|nr:hypothetical protein [Chloroflexota bacterium]
MIVDARGIAIGFLALGFIGGVGLHFAIVGLRNVYSSATAHSGVNAEDISYQSRDLVALMVNGLVLLVGIGMILLTVLAIYNAILG